MKMIRDKRNAIGTLLRVLAVLWLLTAVVVIMPNDFDTGKKEVKEEEDAVSVAAAKEAEVPSSVDDENAGKVLGTRHDKIVNTAARVADETEDMPSVTVMIYMIGSELESSKAEASDDIGEMLASGIGNNVNVLIQTMGTNQWHTAGIASDRTQIYSIKDGELNLERNYREQLDSTSPDTLADFIKFGKDNFKADRYMLLFWDHGAGPVYGFGYDEHMTEDDSLTLDEITTAFDRNKDVHFDIIGMDCCIMANIETCNALAPYCSNAILSEDFESSLGWEYSAWMRELENNPGIASDELGKCVIDSTVSANENSPEGRSTTMVYVDATKTGSVFDKWIRYAYEHEDELLAMNYSTLYIGDENLTRFKGAKYKNGKRISVNDYYISDVLSIVNSIDSSSKSATDLTAEINSAIVHCGHTEENDGLTGLSVTLPYGDQELYDKLYKVYSRCKFDPDYIDWLERFVTSDGIDNYYDPGSAAEVEAADDIVDVTAGDTASTVGIIKNTDGKVSSPENVNPVAARKDGNTAVTAEPDNNRTDAGQSGINTAGGDIQENRRTTEGRTAEAEVEEEETEYIGLNEKDTAPRSKNFKYEYIEGDWKYSKSEKVWYLEDGDTLYLYDEDTALMYRYDENNATASYYDEYKGDWEPCD